MRRLCAVGALAAWALAACAGNDKPSAARVSAPTTAASPTSTASPVSTSVTTSPTTTTSTTAPVATASDAAPATAEEVAAVIEATETAIRNPATAQSELSALGRRQQVAYRTLMLHPEWDVGVRALLPAPLRPVAEAHVNANRELRALTPPPPDGRLPKWQIVAPEPALVLLGHYKGAEAATGVPWQYLAAVHLVETRMGRIRGDSSAGAQGPMQFLPSTWRAYGNGGDIQSSRDSIHAAARLLKANGAPARMAAALYAYNHSQRYVRAITTYAEQMRSDERTYFAYHGWQVYYGDRLLPEGTDLR